MLRTIPVLHIAGVGRMKETELATLGIHSVFDVLHYFPFRYEDQRIQPLSAYKSGDKVTVIASVQGEPTIRWQSRRSWLTAKIFVDQMQRVTAIWFNQHYLKQKLVDGRCMIISGKWDAERRVIVVSHTDFSTSAVSLPRSRFSPVYRGTKKLSSSMISEIITNAIGQYGEQISEALPFALKQKYRLISHRQAIKAMHIPKDERMLHQAHRRLAFEEFFLFQLQLQLMRRTAQKTTIRPPRKVPDTVIDVFCQGMPFPLTSGQLEACKAIAVDFRSAVPMNRLLEGDVGSGKTWVALFAAYAVSQTGSQTALMAPTEILAEQHFREAKKRLEPLGIETALLTGSTTNNERRNVLSGLMSGKIHLVIGTHALLTGDVQFSDLGLVITDEQHRFGVSQRSVLRNKGEDVDVLLLSATPIPRTLAMAIYGDLEISTLKGLPLGRKPIKTYWVPLNKEAMAIRKVRRELSLGRQAYVVAPLVEESEVLDVSSAVDLHKRFCEELAGFEVGLLHGRMLSREKDDVMRKFINGKVHVLVSTTVIEVGIDVPNASVMLIYHADRFGLAELHQLRGRVGRGSAQSFCILLADGGSEVAKRRLQTMTETTNGFVIAEKDLELRGPGEFLGVRQSGLPEFTVGDLVRDFKMMDVARDEASTLLASPDFWLLPEYSVLREAIAQVPAGTHYQA
jgi:ATP-dependent DNA helicase RecG